MTQHIEAKQSYDWAPIPEPGERLLWQGEPAKGLRMNRVDIAQSLMGIPLLALGVFVFDLPSMGVNASSDMSRGFKLLFQIIGFAFILESLYLIVSHYFWNAYRRGHARYALSDRPAMIASQTFPKNLVSYPISKLTEVSMRLGKETMIYLSENPPLSQKTTHKTSLNFEYISDGEEVHRLICKIQTDGNR